MKDLVSDHSGRWSAQDLNHVLEEKLYSIFKYETTNKSRGKKKVYNIASHILT